jgi:hypothetical protein
MYKELKLRQEKKRKLRMYQTKVVDMSKMEYIPHPLADTDYRYKNALIERKKVTNVT